MQPKYCNKCGNLLVEGDKFCRSCGAPVKIRPASVGSPKTGREEPPIPKYDEEAAVPLRENAPIRADIQLNLEEMLRGCTKVVDFGTGQRYELIIPAGLSPSDRILVKDTGIRDPKTGAMCEFELTVIMD